MFFLFAIQCVRMFEMLKELVLLDLRLQLGLSTGIKLYNDERSAPAQHSFHWGQLVKRQAAGPFSLPVIGLGMGSCHSIVQWNVSKSPLWGFWKSSPQSPRPQDRNESRFLLCMPVTVPQQPPCYRPEELPIPGGQGPGSPREAELQPGLRPPPPQVHPCSGLHVMRDHTLSYCWSHFESGLSVIFTQKKYNLESGFKD